MDPMTMQTGVWILAGAILLLYIKRRRKRKTTI
jgi:hypothetical protein